MLFETIGQHRVFLWMLASGMLIGAWYGAMAGLRRLLRAGIALGLLCDLGFGLGAAGIFCLALYTASYGAFRLYAALAALIGFVIFALGAFPAGNRAVCIIKCTARRIFVTIRQNRWIKVIFK